MSHSPFVHTSLVTVSMCVCPCVCVHVCVSMCVCPCVCVCNVQVCAFAGETDADMKGKVILRLMNITELQSQLESCMAGR